MPWEWLLFVAIAALTAAYIALPRRSSPDVPDGAAEQLRAERAALLALLRELDDDAASGRISAADRTEGRRALGPQLRAVTEALADLGEHRDAPAPVSTEPAGESVSEEQA